MELNDQNLELHDNIIYYLGNVSFLQEEYETLKDSKGNLHLVSSSREIVNTKLKTENYINKKIVVNGISLKTVSDVFQYDLKKYEIIYPVNSISSTYYKVSEIIRINDNFKDKISNYNHRLFENKYYFPLNETCFVSSNNRVIDRGIKEKTFFDIEDREKAIENLHYKSANKMRDINYHKMDEKQKTDFIIKRYVEFLNMQKLIKRH